MNACARSTADCPVANTPSIDTGTGMLYTTFWAPGAAQAGLRALRITEDPVPTITPVWSYDALPGGSGSSPDISADGTRVYVNDNVDSLHALDAATGHDLDLRHRLRPARQPVDLAGGADHAGGRRQRPHPAVADRGDRAELAWSRPDLLNRGIPTQTAGFRSYATVSSGQYTNDLVVLDTRTGAELDRRHLGISLLTVGTTVGQDGTILVPTITGKLCAASPPPTRRPPRPSGDSCRSGPPGEPNRQEFGRPARARRQPRAQLAPRLRSARPRAAGGAGQKSPVCSSWS
ncbi:MAG: hypothetical protein R2746_15120 [Acidimicrobiales bacterium]